MEPRADLALLPLALVGAVEKPRLAKLVADRKADAVRRLLVGRPKLLGAKDVPLAKEAQRIRKVHQVWLAVLVRRVPYRVA